MTTACYVVCDEVEQLGRSLRSVLAYVRRVVIVDAAFTSRPGPATHSTDGTRALAERLCRAADVPLDYFEAPYKLDEDVARNRYLEAVTEGEWVLLMDADEVLYADHEALLALLADLPGVETGDVGLQVLTTAVLTPQDAPDISPVTYATRPVISTMGWMPKLVRVDPRLRHARMEVAPRIWTHHGLLRDGVAVDGSGARSSAAVVVNDHVGQSHAGYQLDFAWENAQRHGLVAASA